MIKVTYIVSRLHKSLEYEWLVQYIDKTKFSIEFILLNDKQTPFEEFLIASKTPYQRIHYTNKKHLIQAILKIRNQLLKSKPDIINCNLIDGQIAGLIGGWLAGIRNRVYTRHHSVYHQYYAKHGVFYDKLSNRLAKKIVAITGLVKRVLTEKEGVHPDKVMVIPYGFDFNEYKTVDKTRTENLKSKYNLHESYPVIGVVSRYTHWKGLQYIIPAFAEILKQYPNAKLVLAGAGGGDMDIEVQKMLNPLRKRNYVEIAFENDVAGLFSCFDVFVHAPIDEWVEAFGRIYVEAPASSVPSVFTISGIAHDFVINEENALVVNYENPEQITKAALRLLTNHELRGKVIKNGKDVVEQNFSIERNILSLQSLFEELVRES